MTVIYLLRHPVLAVSVRPLWTDDPNQVFSFPIARLLETADHFTLEWVSDYLCPHVPARTPKESKQFETGNTLPEL
jgi:hypothetical protein